MKILSQLVRRQLFTNHDVILSYGPDKIHKCKRYKKLTYFVKKEIKFMSQLLTVYHHYFKTLF